MPLRDQWQVILDCVGGLARRQMWCFVYERVPHVTLKSIANNSEIDVIWEKWQTKLAPLRESLNNALMKTVQEWEIPRAADAKWPDATKKLHADWWQARIAKQKEIDFVLRPLDDHIPAPKPGDTKLSNKQHNALQALFRCINNAGQPLPASFNLPAPTNGVTVEQWKEELFRAGELNRDAKNPRADFKKLIKDPLKAKNKIAERDGLVWAL